LKNSAIAIATALLLCSFTVASDIFTLKKDTTKTHCNNVGLNVLAIHQAALAGHWLIMGLNTDSSLVDTQLSKMEAMIENIASLAAVGNLMINQLMECEVVVAITTKVAFAKEPKLTMVMAKNVHQVVSRAMETLANTSKQEKCKFNLHFSLQRPVHSRRRLFNRCWKCLLGQRTYIRPI
jgi:hypothetical protein